MKGYSERRGRAFKLAFDPESGQFFSMPHAHDFLAAIGKDSAPERGLRQQPLALAAQPLSLATQKRITKKSQRAGSEGSKARSLRSSKSTSGLVVTV